VLDFLLCLIAEQMIQKVLFEQESKLELAISELDTKVNKSRELYDFCVNLLKNGGIHFSEESSGVPHPITPLKSKQC
jgi:hypothetical protein